MLLEVNDIQLSVTIHMPRRYHLNVSYKSEWTQTPIYKGVKYVQITVTVSHVLFASV